MRGFWSYVDKTGNCWLWKGGKSSEGYGYYWDKGRQRGAHIVSFEMEYGPIPPGMFVLHKVHCSRKACIRPEHLYLGTHSENAKDYYG